MCNKDEKTSNNDQFNIFLLFLLMYYNAHTQLMKTVINKNYMLTTPPPPTKIHDTLKSQNTLCASSSKKRLYIARI